MPRILIILNTAFIFTAIHVIIALVINMKEKAILFLIFDIGIIILLSLLNMSYNYIYLFSTVLILVIISIIKSKKPTTFLLFCIPMCYLTIHLLLYSNNTADTIITCFYIIFMIIALYNGFQYIFDLYNNKAGIKFKNLQFPDNSDYLVFKYLIGHLKFKDASGILTKDKETFYLSLEEIDGNITNINFEKKNIKSIEVESKPYNLSKISLANYEVDYMKSSAIGRSTGSFEHIKTFKIIESFHIKIIFNNDTTLQLLCFNHPNTFFEKK